MMNNLFSIFDTSTSLMFDNNWMSSMSNFMIIPMTYWLHPSKIYFLNYKIFQILNNELKNILMNKFNFVNKMFFTSMFLMIFLNNILGLFPYIFTCSSHMIFSMSISFPLWFGLMIFNLLNNLNLLFSHMIPQGTPNILMPFMVLIESISNIIRPSTLMIRLTANMIAGHLLLTLLSETANTPNLIISNFIILIQIILLILEFSVSIIQSYVFSILSALYLKETN